MKTQKRNLIQSYFILIILLVSSFVLADDLNPPSYRGGPLSVHTHWLADASGQLYLDQFFSVDDADPTATYLYPLQPTVFMNPTTGIYDFRIPNFVDELPLKLLRLQLTWIGTTMPPLGVSALGNDNYQWLPGVVTFISSPLVFTQPDGGYQYFDIEFKPNPDWETINIQLSPDAQLVQVVIDSISTIPEPATMGLLAFGSIAVMRYRKK